MSRPFVWLVRTLRALRALARVEVRQLRQQPKRSLLVMLLVAVPVAAVVGGSTLARITEMSLEEQRVQAMGQAVLRIDEALEYATIETAQQVLPATAQIEPLFVGWEEASVPGARLRAKLIAVAPEALEPGGLAEGLVRLREGRAPRNAGEVALSPVLLQGLERGVGETVTLEFGAERTITGAVVDPEDVDAPLVVRVPAASEYRGQRSLLVDVPAAEAESVARALHQAELSVAQRSQTGGRSDTGTLILALGLLGFGEAALVIAAAFGVSVRRRQREIGLLGATGASSGGIWQS
ncbi:MAG: hypothetical protein AAF657_34100, partial [Acidobacteriota bacterium]